MRRFGLEVEYGGDRQRAVDAIREAGLSTATREHGYMGHSMTEWVVKYDGSVSAGGELVSPPLDFDDAAQRGQVNTAIAALRSSGAKTDRQAGIHVHVDASDLTAEQVAMVARTFTKFEDVIMRLATSGWESMRGSARTYVKPMTDRQIQGMTKVKSERQLKIAYYGNEHPSTHHGDASRYCAVNIHSWFYRKTIEFRVFNSSLNADRIQAYIAICVALVQDARNGKKRSVNKAFRLGGMAAGTTDEKAAYHRWQQVIRYECGMSLEDYKLMNKCWKDSKAQVNYMVGGY